MGLRGRSREGSPNPSPGASLPFCPSGQWLQAINAPSLLAYPLTVSQVLAHAPWMPEYSYTPAPGSSKWLWTSLGL